MATNRLEHIKAEYLRSAYSDVPGEDVQWLVRRVEKLQSLCRAALPWNEDPILVPKLEAAANGQEF